VSIVYVEFEARAVRKAREEDGVSGGASKKVVREMVGTRTSFVNDANVSDDYIVAREEGSGR
jgi:hypothetical protein